MLQSSKPTPLPVSQSDPSDALMNLEGFAYQCLIFASQYEKIMLSDGSMLGKIFEKLADSALEKYAAIKKGEPEFFFDPHQTLEALILLSNQIEPTDSTLIKPTWQAAGIADDWIKEKMKKHILR